MTLVESAAFPHPHHLAEGIERLHCMPTDVPTVPRFVEDTIQVLARLASQHHTSDYSRIKFGPRGCSTRYVPLCIHTPDVYQELRLHQKECNQNNAWWYGQFQGTKDVPKPSVNVTSPSETELVQELSAAMEEPLNINCSAPAPSEIPIQQHLIKTSATHPINISSIIPPEFLALISSHLLLRSCPPTCICHTIPECSRSCRMRSTICEIPPSFSLDRLVFSGCQSGNELSTPPDPPAHTHSKISEQPTSHIRTRSHISQALQAAINSGFTSASVQTAPPTIDMSLQSDRFSATSQSTYATFNSNQSSVSLSLSLTFSNSSLPLSPKRSLQNLQRTPDSELGERVSHSAPDLLEHGAPVAPPILSSFTLGNLLLSSCPGKKVRLQGPVRGRSGVCRNLEMDLMRMKELGVGCIVCCLDDSELEFLGARWPEYERLTRQIGIDVLRLPTPEGLAPSLSAASLNENLTVLIHTYTLRGIPVLVHCRGGVGRAGVVACCWMIRLGLCGWFTDTNQRCFHSMAPSWLSNDSYRGPNSYTFPVRRDTLEMVETAICLVRRRRSVKAVETYEQVKFLVDFVEYLRESA
ncbi:protein-tyrosine phosphatase-like protein [Desarmillaria tabescens]|uniref:Protein-tyrosine phosphatase-like protein n=1 Tax=Armillaria tabescens TaxID=1929756 RepID=A0AA39N9B5_ARMTA|nr:protein-tyrosine phosphatase-like protein [Desarmillaria tabescens]KAK0461393.1 protein-tyrosine phosphatase-like protein [Desarmillaria tabescens]